MIKTKKILAPLDLEKPNKKISGLLYPNLDQDQINSFLEITSDKEWQKGIVIFTGRDVTKNDIFSKIVDSGKKIKSVQHVLDHLEAYLKQVKSLKIGDTVSIKSTEKGFELIKLQKNK